MDITKNTPIGEIVADNYRTAVVFKKYGIDFCCNGGRTITEACDLKKISPEELLEKLHGLERVTESPDYRSWPVNKLIDHILNKHHHYVEQTIPVIMQFLEKLCKVHGERHPELHSIREEFQLAAGELAMHMRKEELILFPFIRKLATPQEKDSFSPRHFNTVQHTIRMMMEEHDVEGERFRKISGLSNDYTPPADACNTYKVTYSLLKEFEADLHLHIHLENNILFPAAVKLEAEQ